MSLNILPFHPLHYEDAQPAGQRLGASGVDQELFLGDDAGGESGSVGIVGQSLALRRVLKLV